MFHVKFADIGEGIHEGVLLKLFFNEGDPVKEGDSLFTLETDKVNAEIPSPVSGKLHINRFKVGAKVHVARAGRCRSQSAAPCAHRTKWRS